MKKIPWQKPDLSDLVLTIGTVSLVVVCLFLLGAPALRHWTGKARVAEVRGNAATLQFAAETFAARHMGRYPEDPLDLIEYLPGDVAPTNPFTGEGLRFRNEPGDLTYRSPSRGQDYIIEAWGTDDGGRPERLLTLRGRR